MTTTDRDITNQVTETLTDHAADFNVRELVHDLIATYDLTGDNPMMTVGDIPNEEYWAAVERHRLPDDADAPPTGVTHWHVSLAGESEAFPTIFEALARAAVVLTGEAREADIGFDRYYHGRAYKAACERIFRARTLRSMARHARVAAEQYRLPIVNRAPECQSAGALLGYARSTVDLINTDRVGSIWECPVDECAPAESTDEIHR